MLASIPACLVAACKRKPGPSASGDGEITGGRSALTAEQRQALEAATARIMPTDRDPGALEANVAGYIDAQLALPELQSVLRTVRRGLSKMEQLAVQQGGKRFARCSTAVQDRVLRQLQDGVLIGRRGSSKPFFDLLLTLTLEGFLCDPVYGGNRGEAGWKVFGIAVKPPRPRLPYHLRRA